MGDAASLRRKRTQNTIITMEIPGASVVISHHIIDGKQLEYEEWLEEIGPLCRSYPGHIDWQIIRPIPNLTFNYTVIIRFDNIANLKNWMESDVRKKLIEKAQPMFAQDDRYVMRTGLEFLFQNGPGRKAPRRWKQYLVTWSAIFPLSLLVPALLLPVIERLPVPQNKVANALIVSGCIVFLMVYFIMPQYTRRIQKWLYK